MARLSLVGGAVVRLDSGGPILEEATVVVEDATIVDVGRVAPVGRTIDCRGKLVLPGFVNAHAHTTEVLFRGLGGRLGHVDWVDRKHALQNAVAEDGAEVGTSLAALEMLRSGAVGFLDPEVHPRHLPGVARAAGGSGLRAGLAVALEARHGYGRSDHHASHSELVDPALPDGVPGDRVSIWLGPRAMSAVTPELGGQIAQRAHDRGMRITIHCSEDRLDVEAVRSESGTTPAVFADRLGLLSERTVMAHCVYLEPADIEAIAASGAAVAHCPVSNAKTGKAIAPLPALLAAGINVAVGTDGGMCNDTYDMLLELRMIALVHRATTENAAATDPASLIGMATRNGARALGFPGGSLEPGGAADVTVVDLRRLGSWPTHDLLDSLVFASTHHVVDTVLVGGEVLLEEGRATRINEGDLLRRAQEVSFEAMRAAGLDASAPAHSVTARAH